MMLSFLRLNLVLLFFWGGTAFAADPINKSFTGLALKGYDPVAYFTESKPVKGSKDFSFKWMDAVWRFASEGNLAQFKQEPEKYAPQYGGYCAWAVSQGYTADIDPQAWKIIDERLYLNYSLKVQKKWEKDISGFIQKADANWPGLKN